MKLTPIKANMTEVQIGNKRVLFSYQTPVAYYEDRKYYATTKKWSNTTSKHINMWLSNNNLFITKIDQSELDNLV